MAAPVRLLAAQAVADVLAGQSLDGPLDAAQQKLTVREDRALLAALCRGTLTHIFSGRFLVSRLVSQPKRKRPPLLDALLLVGLEQLRHMRIPPHAAVSETVAAARNSQQARSAGMINAILRRYLRERAILDPQIAAQDDAANEHPGWLLKLLREDWPDDWPAIVAANNEPACIWLRVNESRISRSDYRQLLGADITREGRFASGALRLDRGTAIADLPHFAEGYVSVQDQAAQLAAVLLDPAPGARILDVCAAPGGKSAHLLEYCEGADLTATDNAAARLPRLRENLERCAARGEGRYRVLEIDMTGEAAVAALGQFDAILLDAPCSGTGVIRRHPDIRLLRRNADIEPLCALQAALLRAAWVALRPGGRLLYATCSVLARENHCQVSQFLGATPDAREVPLPADAAWGQPRPVGRQLLPGHDECDGFYYACLTKEA